MAAKEPPEPLQLGVIPLAFSRHLDGFALIAAGLILIASSLVRGTRIIPFALAAALIPLAPPFLLTETRPLDLVMLAAAALGLGVFVAGVRINRGQESS